MAKKKDKRLGDDPFERFLPQIQDTRKKKEASTSENKSTNDDINKSVSTIVNNNVCNYDDVNNDICNDKISVVDDSNYTNTINDENNFDGTIDNDDIDTSSDDYKNSGSGAFTITKKTKNENYIRMTYYFRRDQLKAIDQLHKQSGRDKSELIRMAVDALIERARVE